MKDLKAEFEQIYSLSIRRGEDSATVWEWLNETYSKQLHKPIVMESLPPETTGYIIYNNDKVNSILGAALRNLDTHQLCTLRDCLIRRTPPTEGGNAP